jgi:SulP family sulfate permease
MTDKKEMIKNTIYKSSLLLPLCLSLGVCAGLPPLYGLITALAGAVLLRISPETDLSPTLLVFLIFLFVNSEIGKEALPLCGITGAVFSLIIYSIKPIRLRMSESCIFSSLSLMTALFITVFVTNSYFGIGASGNTIIGILKSYRSLGFHPNWRGILYGTIVMVVMITFPRKFKKGTKLISAPFYAIIITYILNLLLVPGNTVRTFAEIGKPELRIGCDFAVIQSLPGNGIKPIMTIILSGIAAGIVFGYVVIKSEENTGSLVSASASGAISSVFGIPAVACGNTKAKEFLAGIASAAIMIAVALPTSLFARLPLASAAVVLIVAGWQNLDKPAIKQAFKKPLGIIGLLIAIAVSAIYTPAAGVIIGFIMSFILK